MDQIIMEHTWQWSRKKVGGESILFFSEETEQVLIQNIT